MFILYFSKVYNDLDYNQNLLQEKRKWEKARINFQTSFNMARLKGSQTQQIFRHSIKKYIILK